MKNSEVVYTKLQLINFTQNSSTDYKMKYIILKLMCVKRSPVISTVCIVIVKVHMKSTPLTHNIHDSQKTSLCSQCVSKKKNDQGNLLHLIS